MRHREYGGGTLTGISGSGPRAVGTVIFDGAAGARKFILGHGGLVIDESGRTTLARLYAAGEITGGVHGTNRLMGNSLLDTVVFGRIAGSAAAREALA